MISGRSKKAAAQDSLTGNLYAAELGLPALQQGADERAARKARPIAPPADRQAQSATLAGSRTLCSPATIACVGVHGGRELARDASAAGREELYARKAPSDPAVSHCGVRGRPPRCNPRQQRSGGRGHQAHGLLPASQGWPRPLRLRSLAPRPALAQDNGGIRVQCGQVLRRKGRTWYQPTRNRSSSVPSGSTPSNCRRCWSPSTGIGSSRSSRNPASISWGIRSTRR